MKITAMIPARLGSKRIPQKNLRILDGKPLIQHAIDIAKEANVFSEIIVNSESDAIGELALSSGIGFYKRPAELSTDTATNNNFTADFLKNHDCDFVVMLNSTSPLLSSETVVRFIQFIEKNSFDTVLSVKEIQTEIIFQDKPLNFNYKKKINSQGIEPVYSLAWALTAWRKTLFLSYFNEGKCGTFCGKVGNFTIPESEAYDIDTEEDWKMVEAQFIRQREAVRVDA